MIFIIAFLLAIPLGALVGASLMGSYLVLSAVAKGAFSYIVAHLNNQ